MSKRVKHSFEVNYNLAYGDKCLICNTKIGSIINYQISGSFQKEYILFSNCLRAKSDIEKFNLQCDFINKYSEKPCLTEEEYLIKSVIE